MKEVDEATAEILAAFAPVGRERVPLLAGLGRFLSEDVRARSDAPSFDQSAMDGYAVRAGALAGATPERPVTLPVRGESRAGVPALEPLALDAAMRIFTGAPLPTGADAVVLQEDTTRVDARAGARERSDDGDARAGARERSDDGELVRIVDSTKPGANVRARGSDLRAGELALPAGARLTSGEIGLLASQDVASVPVFRRPRVAILSTGDELREIGEPARPGSIVNSNAYALAAQVLEAGGDPWVLPTVGDQLEPARQAIRTGLAADVLVISGGVSVGDYDVVRDALAAEGIALDFWKVRMKPGKPLAFARAQGVPVLGLPGNPVSAWVTFELFVRPGLRKMLGDPAPQRLRTRVRLAQPLTRKPGRTEFARARLTASDRGTVATLAVKQGSGSLSSLTRLDALVILPADCASVATEDVLEAIAIAP